MPVRQRRGRWHADHGNLAAGAFDPHRRMDVVVAVQDQFDAAPLQHRAERFRVGEPLHPRTRMQGMMHQQNPEGVVGGDLRQVAIERIELRAAKPPRGHQWQRRHRRGDPDQRQRPAPAHERKRRAVGCDIAAQILPEHTGETMPRRPHIGVVVAGNDRDVLRRADAFEPGLGRREFRLQRQVDEVAGYRDVVRPLRLHVGDQRVEHLAAVIFVAVADPVEIAQRPLAGEFAEPCRGQRRQMRI